MSPEYVQITVMLMGLTTGVALSFVGLFIMVITGEINKGPDDF
jgi:hypothetical protein